MGHKRCFVKNSVNSVKKKKLDSRESYSVTTSKRFQKVLKESLKAKKRKEETQVPVFLAGVLKERKELEQARKEAREAGVLTEEKDEDQPDAEKKKTLAEEVADDLYVDLALFLMDSSATAPEVRAAQF